MRHSKGLTRTKNTGYSVASTVPSKGYSRHTSQTYSSYLLVLTATVILPYVVSSLLESGFYKQAEGNLDLLEAGCSSPLFQDRLLGSVLISLPQPCTQDRRSKLPLSSCYLQNPDRSAKTRRESSVVKSSGCSSKG